MKNKRGEIATLLTLGLVILGGVLAIGSSVFLSKQKTTSTRAATTCVIGKKCGSGNYWDCTTANGCDPTGNCKNANLEFACCVQNNNACSDGSDKYRWYGCTGQPCQNTIISQSNGPGHLVACQNGVGPGKAESCQSQSPTPTSPPVPTTPAENSCEKDGKGVCVEKLFNNNTQNCNNYNPGSQPLNRSCGESSNLVCCSNPDYTPPAATKTPTPTININRTGRAGELCIVKQVEPGEPAYVYSCINPGYVCSPPNSSGICVTPTPAGTTPGVTNPAATATPVPPAVEPTLDVSGKCNDIPCGSPDNGLYWSKKCWNPLYSGNTIIGCGGTWSYFIGQGCRDSYQTGSESEAKSSCFQVPRPIHIIVKFVIINLDIEPTKPILHFNISNSVDPSLINEEYSLSRGGNFSDEQPFNINASPLGLKYYVWYNPAGVDWGNSVSGNITVKDEEAEVTITLK